MTSPEPSSAFPGHSFELTGTFGQVWVFWLGVPSQPSLSSTPGPGCFSCSLQRGAERGASCPERDSGGWEQRSLRWGCRAPPTQPHTPKPPGLPHSGDVTLNVTLVTSTPCHPTKRGSHAAPRRSQSRPLHKEGCQERFRRAPAWAARAVCLANELNKVPVAGGALSVSHLVPYRRSDLRCGWVSQVAGHQGKQF